MDKRYQVFISSTFSDLKEERKNVIQTLLEMDCIPAGMELFPAPDEEQWEFIKKIIDDCDYYMLIIGGRYGSLTKDGISYTEKEFDYAKEKNSIIPLGAIVFAFIVLLFHSILVLDRRTATHTGPHSHGGVNHVMIDGNGFCLAFGDA